jgi:hypothetical protein
VTDKNAKTATKNTNNDGKITVPDKTSTGGGGSSGVSGLSSGGSGYVPATVIHTAYVEGYPGGNFRAENSMTRTETSAISARLLSAKNNDRIVGVVNFNIVHNQSSIKKREVL